MSNYISIGVAKSMSTNWLQYCTFNIHESVKTTYTNMLTAECF